MHPDGVTRPAGGWRFDSAEMSAGDPGWRASRRALAGLLRVAEPPAPALVALVEAVGPTLAWEAVRHRDGVLAGAEVIRLTQPRVAGRSPAELDDIAERDLDRAADAGAWLLGVGDPDWPAEAFEGLGYLTSPASPGHGAAPLGLYVRGHELPVVSRSVAVVGSRAATPYGVRVATELAADLVVSGMTVVSGAAFGIDAAAHRGALHAGAGPETWGAGLETGGAGAGVLVSVAVLACGIDRSYPAAHAALLASVAATGAVISEYPPGVTPARYRFLVRNRLIAAFAAGTVVVEAGARSGSLNTAAAADGLSRQTMAVPGPITSAVSLGCHELIRNRGAVLVTGARDVLAALGPIRPDARDPDPPGSTAARPTDGLGAAPMLVYEALPPRGGATVADLSVEAALPGPAVLGALALLEIEGLAERTQGRWRRAR